MKNRLNIEKDYRKIHQEIFDYLQILANAEAKDDLNEKELIQSQITGFSQYCKQTLTEIQSTLEEEGIPKEKSKTMLADWIMELFNHAKITQNVSEDLNDDLQTLYQSLHFPKELFPVHVRGRIHYFPVTEDDEQPIHLYKIDVTLLIKAMARTLLLDFLVQNFNDIQNYINNNPKALNKFSNLAGLNDAWFKNQSDIIEHAIHSTILIPQPSSTNAFSRFFRTPSQHPISLSIIGGMLVASALYIFVWPAAIMMSCALMTSLFSLTLFKIRNSIFKDANTFYQSFKPNGRTVMATAMVAHLDRINTVQLENVAYKIASLDPAATRAYFDGVHAAQSNLSYLISYTSKNDWANYKDFAAGMQLVFNVENNVRKNRV